MVDAAAGTEQGVCGWGGVCDYEEAVRERDREIEGNGRVDWRVVLWHVLVLRCDWP